MDMRFAHDDSPTVPLRAVAASFIALLGAHVELAVIELREEAERRKELTVLAMAAGAFLAMAALLSALFVVVLFWDTHRVQAAAGVTIFYLVAGMSLLARTRQRKREMPPPFEATLAQLTADADALRARHE